jgi:hypothetical protein
MPAAATQPTGKRSKRGRLSEGAPTKKTPQMIAQISEAISFGLTDEETCNFVGIDPDTLMLWKKDPEFFGAIKSAIAKRLVLRLKKIETGADGWQGCAWLTERLMPQRYSKPEILLSLNNSFNQTVNALSITISAEEAKRIEAEAAPIREEIARRVAAYRPGCGNGNGSGAHTVDIQAEPVEKPHEELAPIVRKEGDENSSAFWNLFASGASERFVDKATAILVTALIVSETLGAGRGHQAITAFKSEQPTVGDVLCVIDRLCGGSAGQQLVQRKAGYNASS